MEAGGDWSMVLKSQLLPLLASVVATGKVDLEGLDFSHAARVAGSTGQASAGGSDSFAIVKLGLNALKSSMMMASCITFLVPECRPLIKISPIGHLDLDRFQFHNFFPRGGSP